MDVNIIKGKSVLTNTADAFVGTLSVGDTAYVNGGFYLCKMPITNTTTAPTLNLNGIGVKSIYANNGSLHSIGDLMINSWYVFLYDSTLDRFITLNNKGSVGLMKVFADVAAKTASVPDYNGQLGIQIDIDAVFQSNGTSAGNWIDIIPVTTVIYVDSTKGHTIALGATGSISNPLSTLAEGRTTAVALTPSATLRPRIKSSGYFNEGIVLANYVDWDLGNSVIDMQSGSLAAIDDNNVVCDSIIYGNAKITRSTAGTNGFGLRTQTTSVVTVYAKSITSSLTYGVYGGTGTQTIYATVSSSVNDGAYCSGGNQIIYGNVSSSGHDGVSCPGGTQTIYGNVSSSNRYGASLTSGTQKIYGNVSSTASTGAFCSTGTQFIDGDVSATVGGGAVYCLSGTQTVTGNATSTVGSAVECDGGTQTVYKNASSTSYRGAWAKGGTQIIYGNVSSATAHFGAYCSVAGIQNIYGNVTSSGEIGANCIAGTQTIKGNVSHTGVAASNYQGASCSVTGVQNITGNISTTATGATAYGVTHSSSGSSSYGGNISAVNAEGLNISAGTVRVKSGSRIITTGTNENAILKSGGTLILDGVTLIAIGSGNGISAASGQNVVVLSPCTSNAFLNANVTIQVGSMQIDPTATSTLIGTIIT